MSSLTHRLSSFDYFGDQRRSPRDSGSPAAIRHRDVSGMWSLLCYLRFTNFDQYPMTNLPENVFDLALASSVQGLGVQTVHGAYPPPFLRSRSIRYFGDIFRTLEIPSASLFATLSYFVRTELYPPAVPKHLPATRREADLSHRLGPTQEDVEDFSHNCRTRFPCEGRISSLSYRSSRQLCNPLGFRTYRLGEYTGTWQGSYIVSVS